jgi:hypothetical protein
VDSGNPLNSSIKAFPNINIFYNDWEPDKNYNYNYLEGVPPYVVPNINQIFKDDITSETDDDIVITSYRSCSNLYKSQIETKFFCKREYSPRLSVDFVAYNITIGDITHHTYDPNDPNPYLANPNGFQGHFCEFLLFNRDLTDEEFNEVNEYLKHKWIGDYPSH